ncbi:hypothetical protein REPUB_Repub01dG0270800 [Reevesia pubescens]
MTVPSIVFSLLQQGDLCGRMLCFRPAFDKSDVIIWRMSKNSTYSAKEMYEILMNQGQGDLVTWWKSFWKSKVPSKVLIFLWLLHHDRFPSA